MKITLLTIVNFSRVKIVNRSGVEITQTSPSKPRGACTPTPRDTGENPQLQRFFEAAQAEQPRPRRCAPPPRASGSGGRGTW